MVLGSLTPSRVRYLPSATMPTLVMPSVLRDVPEPAFVRDVGHGGVTFVDAFSALGILVVSPDGDLVEVGVAQAPAELVGGEGFLAGAIDDDGRAHFVGAAGFAIGGFDTEDLLAVHEEAIDGGFLAHFRAFFAGVIEEHLVELGTEDLPGLGDGFTVVAGEEIEGLRAAAFRLHEGDAELLHEVRGLHLGDHADAFERAVGEGDERFADVDSGGIFRVRGRGRGGRIRREWRRRRSRRGRRR